MWLASDDHRAVAKTLWQRAPAEHRARREETRGVWASDFEQHLMSAHETAAASSKYQPSDFLKAVLGRPVIVKLNSVVSYRGILACLDGYMNIAMEQTEEYVARRRRTTRRASLLRGATPDRVLFAGRRSAESQVRRLLHPRQQR